MLLAVCLPSFLECSDGSLALCMSILCYPEDRELTPAARQLRLIGLYKENWKKKIIYPFMETAGKKQQVAVCQQLSVVLPCDYFDVV